MNLALIKNKTNVITRHINAVGQRNVRATCKISVEVESELLDKLESNIINPKHHPGKVQCKQSTLPSKISHALQRMIGDYPVKTLLKDCKQLNQYVRSRHPPPELIHVRKIAEDIMMDVDKEMIPENTEILSEDEADKLRKSREKTIRKTLAQRIYAWKPINYDKYKALVYAIGRSAQEYSILIKILKEIEQRDPTFKPRSFLDFGSGVGSGMWAASSLWKDNIFEYFNVDPSKDMNDLSDLIIREGNENQQPFLKNVYYRQFMPGIEAKYDLVISSFSLFELPNERSRKEVLLKLWQKCDGYMVIVEEGSRYGSDIVNEARSYLLSLKNEDLKGFVFAPCPHDNDCPRVTKPEDKTPCNFEASYLPLKFEKCQFQKSIQYSYLVAKKGRNGESTRQWPRLVRPTLLRSRHVVCRMCTAKGNLQEIIFTQSKHGRAAFRCAKAACWGDRLPIKIAEPYNIIKKNLNE